MFRDTGKNCSFELSSPAIKAHAPSINQNDRQAHKENSGLYFPASYRMIGSPRHAMPSPISALTVRPSTSVLRSRPKSCAHTLLDQRSCTDISQAGAFEASKAICSGLESHSRLHSLELEPYRGPHSESASDIEEPPTHW